MQRDFILIYPKYQAFELDSLRQTEYTRLETLVYLDYTGATLYPQSLVKHSFDYMLSNVLGNPHSSNPPSYLASRNTSDARKALLGFLGADPDVYCVVWTTNASSAMRIIGEGYNWRPGAILFLGQDSHNSLNGLRHFARKMDAHVDYYPLSSSEEIMAIENKLSDLHPTSSHEHPGIFCLTGQSNVTGFKPPLSLLQHASSRGFHTFLDAAALAPTTKISLSGQELNNAVDAMAISIYKIMGFPTGVGALVVKKDFLNSLKKPWFSGGTVDVVQVPGEAFTLKDGPERFEDGTINFLSMSIIPWGLSMISTLIPLLRPRLASLTHWTARALSQIQHESTGKPMVHVRSPLPTLSLAEVSQSYGFLITFEVANAIGEFVNCEIIEYGAGLAGICLRAGCMCNPGGASNLAGMAGRMLEVQNGDRKADLEARFGVRSRGVVRASFGLASNFSDAWMFVKYMRSLATNNRLQNLVNEWATRSQPCTS
ncbi:molybdenum cofactor sulfurase [Hysterangium stoloniferum]|nr:molybdenum cofactor sulfurase [Hysterangium stoloniferum]